MKMISLNISVVSLHFSDLFTAAAVNIYMICDW